MAPPARDLIYRTCDLREDAPYVNQAISTTSCLTMTNGRSQARWRSAPPPETQADTARHVPALGAVLSKRSCCAWLARAPRKGTRELCRPAAWAELRANSRLLRARAVNRLWSTLRSDAGAPLASSAQRHGTASKPAPGPGAGAIGSRAYSDRVFRRLDRSSSASAARVERASGGAAPRSPAGAEDKVRMVQRPHE